MDFILRQYTEGDVDIYYVAARNDSVGLIVYPHGAAAPDAARVDADSMIQVKFRGDNTFVEYSEGISMRNTVSVQGIRLLSQTRQETPDGAAIVSELGDARGNRYVHRLSYHRATGVIGLDVKYRNESGQTRTLELLHSFSICGIRTAGQDARCGTYGLLLHRNTSFWSIEGREQVATFEALGLQPSWSDQGLRNERFGVAGSMPVRKYFPFAAVEDPSMRTVWAVELEAPYSWELEVSTVSKSASLSGGLACYETGHWCADVPTSGEFSTHTAYLRVCTGDVLSACAALNRYRRAQLRVLPAERDMPIIYNEYCTTWGKPDEARVKALLPAARELGAAYFVIDAGWYRRPDVHWCYSIGDWEYDGQLFPSGLSALTAAIEAAGMKAGIWFEFENCGVDSKLYHKTEWLLSRFGVPLNAKYRRFLDLRKAEVRDYIEKKVFDFIADNGFSYVKVDYNENIGIGCDGAESLGEGGRQVGEASLQLFDALGARGIVVENCSSGGHRLEPLRLSKSSMASFSDAHEGVAVPIVAAHVCRMVPPRQNQIWVVARSEQSVERLRYTLAAAFYGRLCFSGEVDRLNDAQRNVLRDGAAFYRKYADLIDDGALCVLQSPPYWLQPIGNQVGVLQTADGQTAIAIVHFFDAPTTAAVPLDGFKAVDGFGTCPYTLENGVLTVVPAGAYTAQIVVLRKM